MKRAANRSTDPHRVEPAGILRRLAALAYDLLLLAALLFVFTLVVHALRGGREVEPGTVWFQLCLVAIIVVFFAGFWVHGGQTLGMKAWRLRVISRDGERIGWPTALARTGAGLLSIAAAGLGLWWAAFDPERRTWHDRLCGTRVVHERR